MESSSKLYTSPSFSRNSSNNIADRVVQQLLTENTFTGHGVFRSNHDENQPDIIDGDDDEEEHEFEFPVICQHSNLFQVSSESVSGDQIWPRYPLFDRSLLSEVDLNLSNNVDTPKTDSKPPPATRSSRSSLMKLFDEDRETSSTSSSEADELDGVSPGTYCVWKPKMNPDPRGKHKKSNSISVDNINTSKRWKVRDLLKRSYSDDRYSSTGKDSPVFLFIPPISPEKVNQIGTKTEKKIPAYKSKIGNVRLPPYLPYREDQLAAYANFTGQSRNLHSC